VDCIHGFDQRRDFHAMSQAKFNIFDFKLIRIFSFRLLAVFAALSWTVTAAPAQTLSAAQIYDHSAKVPTNIRGITTFPAPPPGYDAANATDAANAAYGLPPRPDAQSNPEGFAKWRRAVAPNLRRVNNPLRDMGISSANLMAAPNAAAALQGLPQQVFSTNWSGVASVQPGLTRYNTAKSFFMVLSDFNIPVAQQAFGTSGGNVCDGGTDYEASWNGIDGFGSGDVLQGGSISAASCSGGVVSTGYCGWVEWFPSYNLLCALDVNPGDDMFVETWSTSAAQGYVYIADLTLGTSATVGLALLAGPPLVGSSAEYIVERPCCVTGSTPYPLANYVQNFWAGTNMAYTFAGFATNKPIWPGSPAATNIAVYMVDDSQTQLISYPQTSGNSAIFVQDAGCANTGGC
jgi:hypothetical protein